MSKFKPLYLLGLYLLAVLLRLIVLYQIAGNDPAFDQHEGSDQTAYVAQAQGLVAGTWPDGAFYFQPLYPFFLGALHLVVGPSLYSARAAQAVVLSVGVLICFWLTRRLYSDRAAWIAGLLYAVYPVFIFYDLVFLGAGLVTLAMLCATAAFVRWAEANDWRWAALAGVFVGLAGGAQPAMPVSIVLPAAAFLWRYRARSLGPVIMLGVGLLAALAPYSLWNYRFTHRLTLASTSGEVNLYLGNNRHANGLRDNPLAMQAAEINVRRGRTSYVEATLQDFRADPWRMVELYGRKIAMSWSNPEISQNVDYYGDGTLRSALLRTIPLDFYLAALAGIAGFILHRRDRRTTVMVLLAAAITLSNSLFFISSRQRVPVVPVLIVSAGGALDVLFTLLAGRLIFTDRKKLVEALSALVSSAIVLAVADWSTNVLPRPPLVNQVPAGYHVIGTVGGAAVAVPDSLPPMEPGIPYWVTVYWQPSGPLDRDYKTLIQLIDGHGQKRAQGDHMAGATGFHYYPTSGWSRNDVLRDEFLIIPPDDLPAPLSATIWIGLYDPDNASRRLATILPDGSTADVLTTELLAITRRETVTPPPDAQIVNATIGTAKLTAYAIHDGTLTLYWQAGSQMAEDGIVFVHLFAPSGNFVAGADSRPRNGSYSTLVWQEAEGIVDDRALPADLPPGTYTIKIGMYDAASQSRLTVVNANGETMPDGVLTLGTATMP